MKFVHIADMHFDSPFVNLSDKGLMGDFRRLEQRRVFKKIIEYIKQNDIEFLFISGDLYEHQYIKQSTIEYINNLFKEIPNTRIFISPGNHDPYLKNSYYSKFNWNENVKIFKSEIEKVEIENVNIYGYGFEDFYCSNCGLECIDIEDKNKVNILVMHGSLDNGSVEDKQYNPLKTKMIKEKKFDYVALGHIHKLDYKTKENQRIMYPGSTISLGFDELGKHGMIVGELNKEELKVDFIILDEQEFKEKYIDISTCISKEELVERINELDIEDNEYVKVILEGNRNFEINVHDLLKLVFYEQIIKIKDNTVINIDLDKMINEYTLRGLFLKEMKKRKERVNISKQEIDIIDKAIEIGLNALE